MLLSPSDVAAPVREAGGDNTVERDAKGRPKILIQCVNCAGVGEIPSEKRPGNWNKCQRCRGEGRVKRSFTRTTTYIDVLEDKSNVQAWAERNVLIGVAMDSGFLTDVLTHHNTMESLADSDAPEDKAAVREAKNLLNRKAEAAKDKAGANLKSARGTHLHALSEMVDEGTRLPDGVSAADIADMAAYEVATNPFEIIHMERLVVNDDLMVAGTPDRISRIKGELIAPDGSVITYDDLLITDLKTGRVDLGGLKMCMQLSIYSRSKLYDAETGDRIDLGNVNQKWGIIMHVAAGSGVCTLYWADLELGWEAVQIAGAVRSMRSKQKKALVPVTL